MAKQALKDGKIVEVTGMSVAGGDLGLPTGFKYFVNLRLDYSGVSEDEAIQLASEGSSVRVKAQAKLRTRGKELKEKAPTAESFSDVDVEDLPWFEFDVSNDFESERGGPRDPEKVAQSAFKKMDREAKARLIADTLKVSFEEALAMVPVEEATEEEQ